MDAPSLLRVGLGSMQNSLLWWVEQLGEPWSSAVLGPRPDLATCWLGDLGRAAELQFPHL